MAEAFISWKDYTVYSKQLKAISGQVAQVNRYGLMKQGWGVWWGVYQQQTKLRRMKEKVQRNMTVRVLQQWKVWHCSLRVGTGIDYAFDVLC